MSQNRYALCGFYFVQWDRKKRCRDFFSDTALLFLLLCYAFKSFSAPLVGLRLLRLCLKLRRGFAPRPHKPSGAGLERALYLSLRSVSSILFLIYFSIAASTAFFQPTINSLRLLSLIDGINSLNLSETPTSSSILPQSPQPSPARYAAPVAVDSTL